MNYKFQLQKSFTVAFIFPGWNTDYTYAQWVEDLKNNLLKHRGGFVCVVDYRVYTLNPWFLFSINADFKPIAAVISKKIQAIGNFDRFFFYGHSLGARIAVEVGATGAKAQIAQMDLCDPAGPGFDFFETTTGPTQAAKNVQCIHTTNLLGTGVYNCDHDWRMGNDCGFGQTWDGERSHNICNDYYNAAFDRDFLPLAKSDCPSAMPIDITRPECSKAKMGYFRTFDTKSCLGDFFAAASSSPPYNI